MFLGCNLTVEKYSFYIKGKLTSDIGLI